MDTSTQNGPFGSPLEAILPLLEAGGVIVLDLEQGFVECPGIGEHTTENAPHDCIAYNNGGIPYLHCFHRHCLPVREALHREWQRVANQRQARSDSRRTSDAERERQQVCESARASVAREQRLAASLLPSILEEFRWPLDAVAANSPYPIDASVEDHWRLLLCLFEDDDVVWIGRDKHDSGSLHHKWRFRRAADWQKAASCPGPFVCPSTFRPGVHRRQQKEVLTPRFLVVESDDHPDRNEIGAVFRWIETTLGLPLRAVIDSGNKSVHGWFNYPPPDVFHKLRLWLPAMGCDPAMFAPNQPCRLPGAWRPETGRFQRLLYLA